MTIRRRICMNPIQMTLIQERQSMPIQRRASTIVLKETAATRVLLWAFILNLFIMPVAFYKVFILTPVARAESFMPVAMQANTSSGPEVLALAASLKDNGLAPVILGKVTRSPDLSVGGYTIALRGDNIQAFEYPDHATALAEASNMAQSFINNYHSLLWKKQAHIYVSDKVVIFYMGNQPDIINSLGQSKEIL